MPKYVGHKDGEIRIVSDALIEHSILSVLELPKELNDVSEKELIIGYYVKDNKVESKSVKKIAKHIKVAFVSNYLMKCGISTFGEHLFPEISKHIGDYRIFAEENNHPTGNVNVSPDKINFCWKRGESLYKLAQEINKFNPDVVLINHEWGLFPNARYWLSLLTQLSKYRVIVIMHSIFHHLDKLICEAPIKEIVVHSKEAVNALKDVKGITGNVSVIPHGCYTIDNTSKLWNIYRSSHTFLQVGFGLRYKSFETSIKATALLKQKFDDVFFTAIFSESDYSRETHQLYYNELFSLINALGIQDNVAIVRGYQSDKVIDSYFRTNSVSVFPYYSHDEHKVFGASGSARLAMAYGIPVITSHLPHFSDLPTIKIDTSEQLANELDKLFADNKYAFEQIEKQNQFIVANNWENAAKQYVKLLENAD